MIKSEMKERAAKIWDVDSGSISYTDDGEIVGPNDKDGNEQKFSFNELAGKLQ